MAVRAIIEVEGRTFAFLPCRPWPYARSQSYVAGARETKDGWRETNDVVELALALNRGKTKARGWHGR